jgi:hypothetical protein
VNFVQGIDMAISSTATGRQLRDSDPHGSWDEPEKPARDWKKRALVVGLGVLSWVATYVGMLELIEANMGELPLVHKAIIGFSVAMLMTMVVWLLDEMFKPNPFFTKVLYAFGYLFLTIISIGFGFGFYWKVLESRSEASRSAEGAVSQVQGSLIAASTRLDQLQSTLDQLTAVSTTKAATEKASGTSCPNSKPGDGPRRKLREDDAARFSFAADFVKGRALSVKSEMSGLDADLLKITGDDKSIVDKSGTRNGFMQGLSRKLDNTVTGFNAFRTDPQLKQIRTDLAERAEKTTFPDTQGKTYSCPDAQLQTALRGVVRAIDQLPELEKPKIAAVEGSEATIEAFRRLTASFFGLMSFKLPPSADELRDLQKKAVQSVEAPSAASRATANIQPGLSKRDYVPLAIAVFVDLCLLLVSMGKSHDRLAGLVPKMRAAERGPVIQILSRFNDIHRDREIRENFELFRHVVFDFHGDYYVAVPLDAPRKMNPREREELRLETQLLSNLFASFEKEKIFTRVYSPFLTASAIRKRLARQGSKFERSDAFRIYRFKDGAWSDIILGAVMGAAKRVEAEQRVQRQRADAAAERADEIARTARPTGPYGAIVPDIGEVASAGRVVEPFAPTPAEPDLAPQFGAYAPFVAPAPRTTHQPGNVHQLTPRSAEPEPMVRAANSNTAPNRVPVIEVAPTPVADVLAFSPPAAFRPGPQYNPRGSVAVALPEPVDAPASFQAVAQPAISAAVQLAQPVADGDRVIVPEWQNAMSVVISRVTESITVPVTEASLPHALMNAGLMRGAAAARSVDTVEMSQVAAPSVALPAPDTAEWSDSDTEIAKRYARLPAE